VIFCPLVLKNWSSFIVKGKMVFSWDWRINHN